MRTSAALLGLLVVAFCTDAYACAELSIERAVGASSTVFIGTVLRLAREEMDDAPGVRLVATIRVQRSYKGEPAKQVTVHSDVDGFVYPFEVGRQYLVYASPQRGVLSTSRCTRSAPVGWAYRDLRALEALRGGAR